MAVYQSCREKLLRPDAASHQSQLQPLHFPAPTLQDTMKFIRDNLSHDEMIVKYLNRLKQKLKSSLQ